MLNTRGGSGVGDGLTVAVAVPAIWVGDSGLLVGCGEGEQEARSRTSANDAIESSSDGFRI